MNHSYATGIDHRLWLEKTTITINEVSMVRLSILNIINAYCKSARLLNRTSIDLFDGLPMVILRGNFNQFSPVGSQPL